MGTISKLSLTMALFVMVALPFYHIDGLHWIGFVSQFIAIFLAITVVVMLHRKKNNSQGN